METPEGRVEMWVKLLSIPFFFFLGGGYYALASNTGVLALHILTQVQYSTLLIV